VNVKLVWTRGARIDRAAIYDYIEAENPRAAVELDEQFDRRAAQLTTHPMIGRGGRVQNTRELVVGPGYLLVYDIEGDTIRILRVLHGAQQWPPEKP
jgi:toxin ParE1/3/4